MPFLQVIADEFDEEILNHDPPTQPPEEVGAGVMIGAGVNVGVGEIIGPDVGEGVGAGVEVGVLTLTGLIFCLFYHLKL